MLVLGYVVLGFIIAGAVLVARMRRRRRESNRVLLDGAAQYAQTGRYAQACYHYGLAAWGGAEPAASHVRALWRAHGPFDFSQTGNETRDSYCRNKSCGEGFHSITTREIARIVASD